MANLFCPATGFECGQDYVPVHSCSQLSNTGHAHQLGRPPQAPEQTETRPPLRSAHFGTKHVFVEVGNGYLRNKTALFTGGWDQRGASDVPARCVRRLSWPLSCLL